MNTKIIPSYSSKNEWWIEGEKLFIRMNRRITVVNKRHIDLVLQTTWYEQHGYAIGTIGNKKVRLHRLITGAPEGKVVDHINHHKLDNLDENLKICTHAENAWNLSRQTGVSYYKRDKKWRARIEVRGKVLHLGYFDSYEKALEVRKRAEREYQK
ncbi:MAG: HNH endonuclease [Anaerotardibacter sp.]